VIVMPLAVSRVLRWAAAIGVGIVLALAARQNPVLAYAPGHTGAPGLGVGLAASVGALAGFALALSGRRRPLRASRRPVPSRPVSVSRPPGRRRSRR
jgi:hypothetical protein